MKSLIKAIQSENMFDTRTFNHDVILRVKFTVLNLIIIGLVSLVVVGWSTLVFHLITNGIPNNVTFGIYG